MISCLSKKLENQTQADSFYPVKQLLVKILLKIVNLNKFNEPKLILEIFKMFTLVADIYERVFILKMMLSTALQSY